MTRDERIDAYIATAAPFARPILTHFRALVHRVVPDASEAIKWGMPHFVWRGKNIAGMAAFKAHAAIIIHDEGRQGEGHQGEGHNTDGMGSYGKITGLADLPSDDVLTDKLNAARARIEAGPKARSGKPKALPAKADIAVPDDLAAALSSAARAFLDGLPPSHRREYLEWIVEAKRPETRTRRIAQAAEWLADGKRRNWKYESR